MIRIFCYLMNIYDFKPSQLFIVVDQPLLLMSSLNWSNFSLPLSSLSCISLKNFSSFFRCNASYSSVLLISSSRLAFLNSYSYFWDFGAVCFQVSSSECQYESLDCSDEGLLVDSPGLYFLPNIFSSNFSS